MPLNLKEVHKFVQDPQTKEFRLHSIHPAVSLKEGDNPAIWIQDGGIYFESGQEVTEVPEWFWKAARRMTPAERQSCGLRLPEEAPKAEVAEPKADLPTRKAGRSCPQCGQTGIKNLGSHIRWRHKKREGS